MKINNFARVTFDGLEEGTEGYETVQQVAKIMEQVLDLIIAKSQSYGEAWREQGWQGNVARVLSKSTRIKNMLWQDFEVQDKKEGVEDTFMDLIAISCFAIINRRNGNKWGRVR